MLFGGCWDCDIAWGFVEIVILLGVSRVLRYYLAIRGYIEKNVEKIPRDLLFDRLGLEKVGRFSI